MPPRSSASDQHLAVAIFGENETRVATLEEGLRSCGVERLTVIAERSTLLRQLTTVDPDVIVIDMGDPSRADLEQMFQVSRVVARPVAMFVDRSDRAAIEAAIEAGVSAYIVDGLKQERVKTVVDMAISRFNAFEKLRAELEAARAELADRKTVDRAKGILMKSRGIVEEEAYALLRKTAMNQSRKLADVAESVVTAASLLQGE